MHLRFVEIFCDVAQRRSFSKGAEAQNVSQSNASQAVSKLEERLGTLLIDRSKRPLELTPAGQMYFEGCREILERFRTIEDRVQAIADRVVGPVRVAAIYSVGLMQMEQTVHRFEQLYPDASLRLDYLHPDQVYQQVLDDKADLGLVSYPRPNSEILSIDWQVQPLVLVVPPQHRLAGQHAVSLSALDGENYIGFTRELTIRREIDRQLKRARVAVQIVREFDNIENIKRAIEAGSGLALLPKPTVWQEISSGTLVAVDVSDASDLVRPLGIIHKRHKQLTTAVRKFIELLQSPSAGLAPVEPVRSISAGKSPAHAAGAASARLTLPQNGHAPGATVSDDGTLIVPRRKRKSRRT
ncbi:MAG: LysR family transcriptional regulator [Planctomycetes bacterium]|nr:LysR family transcriptional regulator [Planctomycetota bacterium]